MIAVLTPEEMGAVDRAAPEPVEVLVRRAAGAVARAALEVLGRSYGQRVVVVAGPGNNGWDGRVAGELLTAAGVQVRVVDALDAPAVLPPADLVIDAAFGTGFRGTYWCPDPNGAPVLAVDIASGISGATGIASGAPANAIATVTFAAAKPGLLLADGPAHSGTVRVVDIGLPVDDVASIRIVEPSDVVSWVPGRGTDDHKWRHAVWCIAGSPGMSGAASLCSAAALRGGAGYVRLSTPGDPRPAAPVEAVVHEVPAQGWADTVLGEAGRFAAVAVGPGLGRSSSTAQQLCSLVGGLDIPVVVDGDGLTALGRGAAEVVRDRTACTVLTPHDGEFETLTGAPPGPDRIGSARQLAAATGAVVLLKGSTTVVADPAGQVLMVRAGDARLATAGTGDVLTGLVAAHLALGAAPLEAAASAAQVHGGAAMLGPDRGLIASDLLSLVPQYWQSLLGADRGDVTSVGCLATR